MIFSSIMFPYNEVICILDLLLIANILHDEYYSHTHEHYIFWDSLKSKVIKPLTVSEIQSNSINGRNNQTFIWCSMSWVVIMHQYEMGYSNLLWVQLTLALLAIFPLQTYKKQEVVICISISSYTSNLIHYILVTNYMLILPWLLWLVDDKVFSLILVPLGIIVYAMICKKYKFTLIFETLYICSIPLIIINS